uniref:Uncharacterized protein n=1 Tax=Arundo donax TaxID=35708 RepID=A0A0A9CF54_ARUDO
MMRIYFGVTSLYFFKKIEKHPPSFCFFFCYLFVPFIILDASS